ncbi:MAG: [FeFe] hydrogenase H-cluster radical SAM maturase HydE [Bacteroidales bacterium]|jgi:biotin synthase|nr:[FeFe] hydrogenase H-cluster radical SAM maturase HydE [Bacteroidales bacterium]
MMCGVENILKKEQLTKEDLVFLLSLKGEEQQKLFDYARKIREEQTGKYVYFRGLLEYSNLCSKDCLYCGIRKSNTAVIRYIVEDEEVMTAARLILSAGYGSMVLQSGERSDRKFTEHISYLLRSIKSLSDNKIGITLSCGEQSEEVYKEWFVAGAHRYLLRIESSNPTLYKQLHPQNQLHDYHQRVKCLQNLKQIGYQVGTGVMIGVPGQTLSDLADDLLFFKEQDIDMIGMGPYSEHHQTPLYARKDELLSQNERFYLTLNMIAVLRIFIKDVNIAAATAMQALHPQGRELAVKVGANVIMPNLTPTKYRENYQLYDNKPCVSDTSEQCMGCLQRRLASVGTVIGYNEWGDAQHFFNKKT